MTSLARSAWKRIYDGWNSRLRWVGGGRFARFCRPTWISFLITERCNARCVHCDIWKNRGKEDSPTVDEWNQVLTDLRSWIGPTHVCLTGGEALLYPWTVDVVRHGARLGLMMELLTHGYWKDESRIVDAARSRPWRFTLSLDGIGDVHSAVRGRTGFAEWTHRTIDTLVRLRREERLVYSIRLKTVVMRQNIDDLVPLAEFATQDGVDIFFQPIEQNYNTAEDPEWYRHSANWPDDPGRAVAAVERLLAMKREGFAIANSEDQLRVMIPYFRDPAAWRVATQSHTANEEKALCAALSLLQVHSNGDVRVCASAPPIGNIKEASVRDIWYQRPTWWESGCCLENRLTLEERARTSYDRVV
jgi:MoaA/NifB/PqqE/SkfB family radical SAM enzyme